jgi:hypothetical protein
MEDVILIPEIQIACSKLASRQMPFIKTQI